MAEAVAQMEKPTTTSDTQSTLPRKRRRRAPTTGAADDCFACQDRHSKCDRRRPYCTQCLDQGKDCSGYKTTLTWGVGVASRGKLRGLALPIAKSKKAVQEGEGNIKISKKSSTIPQSKSNTGSDTSKAAGNSQAFTSASQPGFAMMPMTFGFVNVDPNSSTPSPMLPPPSVNWGSTALSAASSTRNSNMRESQRSGVKRSIRRHSLEPLHVHTVHSVDNMGTMPMTAGVFGGFGDHHYESAMNCSPIGATFQTLDEPMPMYKALPSQHPIMPSSIEGNFFTSYDAGSWPREAMSSSLSSDQSSRDFQEDDGFLADPVVANTLDHILTNPHVPDVLELKHEDNEETGEMLLDCSTEQRESILSKQLDDAAAGASLVMSRSLQSLSIGNTPGLRFLINYYDKVIAPVIVAFDGPTNPYKSHILRLAVESETLQHAIAALSASNLRMRREHNASTTVQSRPALEDTPHGDSVRKSSIAHSLMNEDPHHSSQPAKPGEPSPEELHHKGESIRALNAQLADPLRRKDDSILATLLVLCLYHICDTGVAKFKTQFAGVKKILALRGETVSSSKETKWLTTMFTWFDAMTATVNDREGQFQGDSVDTTIFDNEEWALENLAGCDGRLFKIIAKLGRLNLLSQNKPVAEHRSAPTTPKPQPQPLPSPKTQEYYSMNYRRFDGNGWASLPDEDNLFATQSASLDQRLQFWKEWTDIRQSLQEWQLDPSAMPPPMYAATLEVNRRDLAHISESFRYSALLYTERLAYPHLPSSAANFQRLVAQALFHIDNVKSDVYLLWPLFITGTECVEESHRALIRQRCWDIQKDSGFFNNISGLELLERIWRDAEGVGRERCGESGAAEGFKWRKAMSAVDGEYIVI
ncbi:hypothetical protein MMC06_002449 [Schaereria dolodes]|nr:hypothetical protein [Schaereria dolodes]